GIRGLYVTGVQTCALPIFERPHGVAHQYDPRAGHELEAKRAVDLVIALVRYVGGLHGPPEGRVVGDRPRQPELALADLKLRHQRSEERRVGKEGRSGGWGG